MGGSFFVRTTDILSHSQQWIYETANYSLYSLEFSANKLLRATLMYASLSNSYLSSFKITIMAQIGRLEKNKRSFERWDSLRGQNSKWRASVISC